MDHFPSFMKNPANAVSAASQSKGVQGYVFVCADGSQMAFWECDTDIISSEHVHDFDEYLIVAPGLYTVIIGNKRIPLAAGQEYFIPGGIPHAGEAVAGTRTIHAFGGLRAERIKQKPK